MKQHADNMGINKTITIYQAEPRRRGVGNSARGFTKKFVIEPGDTATLAAAVEYDNCLAEYAGGHRTGGNFKRANVVMGDIDNSHSDEPNDWIYPADVAAAFPDVACYQYPSRNNMKSKNDKEPRPKFHNLFMIEPTGDIKVFAGYMRMLIERFPQLHFDTEVKSPAQLNFGVENVQVTYIDGSINLTEFFNTIDGSANLSGTDKTSYDRAAPLTADKSVINENEGRNAYINRYTYSIMYSTGDPKKAVESARIENEKICRPPLDAIEFKTATESAIKGAKRDILDNPDWKPSPVLSEKKNTSKKKPDICYHTGLAQAYMNEHKYIVGVQKLCKGGYGNDTVYEYIGGAWIPQSDTDVKSVLAKRVFSDGESPDPKEVNKAYQLVIMSGERKDVEEFNSDENFVCFRNGVYRLSDGTKLEHSPDYYFTIQLNADIPDALKETPYCDLCISNFGGTDEEELILQIYGAAISNVNCSRFKKSFLLNGAGNTGKTQLKTHCERVLGNGNYNNVDLSDLENNRFAVAVFQHGRLGGSNDLSNQRIREVKIFKQLNGGDSIQAENKGENSFTFHYKGMLWFLSNQLPLFGGDKGDHVYDRWIVLTCNNPVPPEKRIKNLCDLMFEERDSFCIKALQALQRAINNNYNFTIPESCKRAGDEYKRKNSVVRTFITECCEQFNRDKYPKWLTAGKFWDAFKMWCTDGNYYQPGKGEFRHELAQIAGVDEKQLIYHTKDGDYYPFVLSEDYIKNEYSSGVPCV